MGLNFRKSLKIVPGVKLNIGKKGISSVSLGAKGASVNIGRKGVRSTLSIPKTGISYTNTKSFRNDKINNQSISQFADVPPPLPTIRNRKISIFLAVAILLFPYLFSWFTLRAGHSTLSRVISFGWMFIVILLAI